MVDVVTVPIKREEDEPGYEPSAHAPSPTTQHVPTFDSFKDTYLL